MNSLTKTSPSDSYKGLSKRSPSDILGVPVDDISTDQLIGSIRNSIQSRTRSVMAYVNIHAVNLAHDLPWFRNFMKGTDLNYCDGYGIVLGSWMLGEPIRHRNSPPDWIESLMVECVRTHYTIFLLGGQEGIAVKAAAKLSQEFPGLRIVGVAHGYFEKSLASKENEEVVRRINSVEPDILLVGMGMPTQERWLRENLDRLEIRVALSVGALFDYMTGNIPRPPRWMREMGFEWLGRLLIEPKRLWKRYVYGIPRFFFLILRVRIRADRKDHA